MDIQCTEQELFILKKVAKAAEQLNVQAFLIGGFVRDYLLQRDFKKDIDNIILKIVDDGIGFEVNTRKKGIGLQNMLSRTNECDGVFDIDSKKGKGTAITITVPIQKNTVTA